MKGNETMTNKENLDCNNVVSANEDAKNFLKSREKEALTRFANACHKSMMFMSTFNHNANILNLTTTSNNRKICYAKVDELSNILFETFHKHYTVFFTYQDNFDNINVTAETEHLWNDNL